MYRIEQKNVHGLPRRFLNWFRRLFLNGAGKAQSAFFVTINNVRYKRVVFGDSSQAADVADALELHRHHVALPQLVFVHENEVWVRFVEGRKPDIADHADWCALNDFFASLYASGYRQVELARTEIHNRLLIDLRFLMDSAVIKKTQYEGLIRAANEIRPQHVWLGSDYVDPVLKNFVIGDDGLVAIDIESIQSEVPLGTGLAKSALHWLGSDRDAFMERLITQPGVPDLRPQWPYVELSFLAAWTKRKLLTGKFSRVRSERFEAFL